MPLTDFRLKKIPTVLVYSQMRFIWLDFLGGLKALRILHKTNSAVEYNRHKEKYKNLYT